LQEDCRGHGEAELVAHHAHSWLSLARVGERKADLPPNRRRREAAARYQLTNARDAVVRTRRSCFTLSELTRCVRGLELADARWLALRPAGRPVLEQRCEPDSPATSNIHPQG
jgi:hypothetical protein